MRTRNRGNLARGLSRPQGNLLRHTAVGGESVCSSAKASFGDLHSPPSLKLKEKGP